MSKIKLKANNGLGTNISGTIKTLVLFLVVFNIGLFCVVPLLSALVIFARTTPLEFTNNILSFILATPFMWWSKLIDLNQTVPVFVITALYFVAFFVLCASVWSQRNKGVDKKAIFGPAAVKTHEQGSAHVETDDRIHKANTRSWVPSKEPYPYKSGGVVLGYSCAQKRLYISDEESHVGIIGVPGSGKSRGVLIPSIYVQATAGDSIVTTDPKGEIYSATHRFLENNGYQVWLIDFRNPARSHLWSATTEIVEAYYENIEKYEHYAKLAWQARGHNSDSALNNKSADQLVYEADSFQDAAYEQAEDLAKDLAEVFVPMEPGTSSADFWNNSARGLITALILFICIYDYERIKKQYEQTLASLSDERLIQQIKLNMRDLPAPIAREQRSLESVQTFLNVNGRTRIVSKDGKRETVSDLSKYFEILPDGHPAKNAWYQALAAGDATLQGMIVTAQERISRILSRSFNSMSYESEFRLADIGKKKTAVFLIIPSEEPVKSPPAVMFITLLFKILLSEASKRGHLDQVVQINAEELGVLPVPIPRLADSMAISRSYRIYFNLFIQGNMQLEEKYGRIGKANILDKCNTLIFLKTNDVDTAESISKRLGTYTYDEQSSSSSHRFGSLFDGSGGTTTHKRSRPWASTDEVLKWSRAFGNIVFRSNVTDATRNSFEKHNLRKVADPAVFKAVELERTPIEKALGLGSREHNAALWAEDELIDRRSERKRVRPWTGKTVAEVGEAAEYAFSDISPELEKLFERFECESTLDSNQVDARQSVKQAEIIFPTDGQFKANLVNKASAKASLGKVCSDQNDVMKKWVKNDIARADALANKLCATFNLEYEPLDISDVRQDFITAQKRAIKRAVINNPAFVWTPDLIIDSNGKLSRKETKVMEQKTQVRDKSLTNQQNHKNSKRHKTDTDAGEVRDESTKTVDGGEPQWWDGIEQSIFEEVAQTEQDKPLVATAQSQNTLEQLLSNLSQEELQELLCKAQQHSNGQPNHSESQSIKAEQITNQPAEQEYVEIPVADYSKIFATNVKESEV